MRFLFAALLIISTSLVFAGKPNFQIQRFKTQSGMPVSYVYEPGLPILDVRLVFNAGSDRDGTSYGLANLTSDLLSQGTTQWSADQIANRLDDHGAQFWASTNRDMTLLTLRTLVDSADLKANVALLSTLASQLNIQAAAFSRIKNKQLTRIKVGRSRPGYRAQLALFKTLYAGTPYASPVMGTLNSVQALTLPDVMAFYKQFYVAKNAQLVLVGDITVSQAKAIAKQIDMSLPPGEKASPVLVNPPPVAAQTIHIKMPSQQTTVLVATLAPEKGDPRNDALKLANTMLGGESALSVLYQQIREENGLAYDVHSNFSSMKHGGIFYITAQTRNNRVEDSLGLIEDVMSEFYKTGFNAKAFKNGQAYLTGHFPLLMDSNANIANLLVVLGFYNYPKDYLATYQKRINALKAPVVSKIYNQVVNLNKLLVITVGGQNQ